MEEYSEATPEPEGRRVQVEPSPIIRFEYQSSIDSFWAELTVKNGEAGVITYKVKSNAPKGIFQADPLPIGFLQPGDEASIGIGVLADDYEMATENDVYIEVKSVIVNNGDIPNAQDWKALWRSFQPNRIRRGDHIQAEFLPRTVPNRWNWRKTLIICLTMIPLGLLAIGFLSYLCIFLMLLPDYLNNSFF